VGLTIDSLSFDESQWETRRVGKSAADALHDAAPAAS
jgi:hypothetical protein